MVAELRLAIWVQAAAAVFLPMGHIHIRAAVRILEELHL